MRFPRAFLPCLAAGSLSVAGLLTALASPPAPPPDGAPVAVVAFSAEPKDNMRVPLCSRPAYRTTIQALRDDCKNNVSTTRPTNLVASGNHDAGLRFWVTKNDGPPFSVFPVAASASFAMWTVIGMNQNPGAMRLKRTCRMEIGPSRGCVRLFPVHRRRSRTEPVKLFRLRKQKGKRMEQEPRQRQRIRRLPPR